MNKVIYRIKGTLATLFVATISYAILLAAFENWYLGETSLAFRNSPTRVIALSEDPLFFYAVLGFYALLGFFLLIFAFYLAYKTIYATPETMDKIARSSRFFFGKSDPGLLWVGAILLVGFILLVVKTQFGF